MNTETANQVDQGGYQQTEMPFAMVRGQAYTELPQDLYIPPDALEVFLEAFEGPLDLLLYLIKRQNMDVLDIRIAEITRQYMEYIEMMKDMRLELAAEYLVMAAMLAELKSRSLLPRPSEDENEEDPRAELIRRLQEYERFKKAAEDIDILPRMNRDTYQVSIDSEECHPDKLLPETTLQEMLLAFSDVLRRADMFSHHQIRREPLSVRERMSAILSRLPGEQHIEFIELLDPAEGKKGVVVSFLAILELTKESLIEIVQQKAFAPIYAKAKS